VGEVAQTLGLERGGKQSGVGWRGVAPFGQRVSREMMAAACDVWCCDPGTDSRWRKKTVKWGQARMDSEADSWTPCKSRI
jgi:hypothetical protein